MRAGAAWGLVGVVGFSFTVPLTRVAVVHLPTLVVGAGRAVVAATLAATLLALVRPARPRGTQWTRVAVVAGGVVLGFPLLTSFALTTAAAGHAAVVVGLLPAATAVAAVLRTGESPSPSFWVWSGLGAVATVTVASWQGGGLGRPAWSDLLLLAAVVAAAVGYAEGGVLARELGAWPTVAWALVLALPVTLGLTLVALDPPGSVPAAPASAWWAFGYLAAVSMFLAFLAWYRGLAIGPMAQVSQIQLVQPVLSLTWATLLLGEPLTWPTAAGGVLVVVLAGLSVRSRARAR